MITTVPIYIISVDLSLPIYLNPGPFPLPIPPYKTALIVYQLALISLFRLIQLPLLANLS
jgi:hypothetical protein